MRRERRWYTNKLKCIAGADEVVCAKRKNKTDKNHPRSSKITQDRPRFFTQKKRRKTKLCM